MPIMPTMKVSPPGKRVKFDKAPERIPRPRSGKKYERTIQDWSGSSWTSSLSASSVTSALAAAQTGQPKSQNDLIDQALETDPTLAGIYATRLYALCGLQWEVVASVDETDKNYTQAQEAADYVTESLGMIEDFRESLRHLADSIGRSYAVCENVWQQVGGQWQIVQLNTVRPNSVFGDSSAPWKLRVMTTDTGFTGTPVEDEPLRWTCAIPSRIGDSPFRGGAVRSLLAAYLLKRFGFQWLATFVELFGTPKTAVNYPSGAKESEKDAVADFLDEFGNIGYIVMPEGFDAKMLETSKGTSPHDALIDRIEKWYSIRLLGQTLTTQMDTAGGSYSAALMHNVVRMDIRQHDIENEMAYVGRQVVKPLAQLRFGPDVPVPIFRRVVEKPKDLLQTQKLLGGGVNELGMNITRGYASSELGIPLAPGDKPEDILPGGVQASPFGGFGDAANAKV